jgi:hypothetical protein
MDDGHCSAPPPPCQRRNAHLGMRFAHMATALPTFQPHTHSSPACIRTACTAEPLDALGLLRRVPWMTVRAAAPGTAIRHCAHIQARFSSLAVAGCVGNFGSSFCRKRQTRHTCINREFP